MSRIIDAPRRGVRYIRENPHLLYTIFLIVAIPLAFFYSSEQFVRVARDTQNRLERSRVGLLGDVFAEFASIHMDDPTYIAERIATLAAENETISSIRVITDIHGDAPIVIASTDGQETGGLFTIDVTDRFLLGAARGNPTQSFATEEFRGGVRHWRVVRAIPSITEDMPPAGYFVADVSMAEADRIARTQIDHAYIILFGVIILLLLLLARQARIVDYAALYGKLKEVDRMKDDFVAMAAHELRSPLAVIRAYAEELKGETSISDGGKGFVERIDSSAKDLNVLIGDILDVAKLQEGRMTFTLKDLDSGTTLTEIVESFRPLAEDKTLALSYEKKEELPPIVVDPDRFRQIMTNLVGNAVKYTPKGSVTVVADKKEKTVEIRVSDTGIGISAEDQKRLFQKFFRVKSDETRAITGTGLGLWITAEMVRQMKGSISVESIKGKGTDFIVEFPISVTRN